MSNDRISKLQYSKLSRNSKLKIHNSRNMTEEEKKDLSASDAQAGDAATEAAEETKEEAPAADLSASDAQADDAGADFEVPAEYKDMIEKIESMTVLELHGLVKAIEGRFGVSAQAVAVAGPAGGDAGAEEKSDYIVHLTSFGESKIGVIKAVKEILGLGLKEAKELVESAPADLKSGVKPEEAEEMKAKLTEAGASVELK